MSLFSSIKHIIQTRIYHSCLNIHKERQFQRIRTIIDSIHYKGKKPYIHESAFVNGGQYMFIGEACSFGKNAWVECIDKYKYSNQSFCPKLCIGDNFSMQYNCHIGCIEHIEIGNDVLLGSKVYITDHFHGEISSEALAIPPIKRPLWSKPVKIGNSCWIGDNVCIMPGVSLGNNVIVGANAVVTHSFEDDVVIAGVPARIIRKL